MLKLTGYQGNTHLPEWLKFKSQSTLLWQHVEIELPYTKFGLQTFTSTRENYLALSTKVEHMNTQDTTIPLTGILPTQCNMYAPTACTFAAGILVGVSNWKLISLNSSQHIVANSNNEMHRLGAVCYKQHLDQSLKHNVK